MSVNFLRGVLVELSCENVQILPLAKKHYIFGLIIQIE